MLNLPIDDNDRSLLFTTLRTRSKLDKAIQIKENIKSNYDNYLNSLVDSIKGNSYLSDSIKKINSSFESLKNG